MVPLANEWLQHVAPRLQGEGFVHLDPQRYLPRSFKYAVRRTRFEITKFGMAETFFVFAEIENLVPQIMTDFSAAAFRFAIESATVPLPRGFFESVFCFPVAITHNIDPRMVDWVRQTCPPKHWASCEMPVAFDTTQRILCYFEQTPLWGAAYFSGFRQQIQLMLG